MLKLRDKFQLLWEKMGNQVFGSLLPKDHKKMQTLNTTTLWNY